MKAYIGLIVEGDCVVLVEHTVSSARSDLPLRTDIRSHSPCGFAWGYEGSGPAQLALAMLADHFGPGGEDRALSIYQEFKRSVIARLRGNAGFLLTAREIDRAVMEIEAKLWGTGRAFKRSSV